MQTSSYAGLAAAIGKPGAYRAVAEAKGVNQLAIVIPCHRVINSRRESF
ncbi:MGMT family protein [Paenibacillus lutrae]